MNKLRQSFRRKKDVYVPEASRPHQWQTDEEGVRTGKCSFPVKVRISAFLLGIHEVLLPWIIIWVFLASKSQKYASLHIDLFYGQPSLQRMRFFFFFKPDESS